MIKLILFFISISFIVSGCSTVKDAFDPQRKNGSEEFLVEKKSPLSMPPNFGELPVPKNEKQKNIDEENEGVACQVLQRSLFHILDDGLRELEIVEELWTDGVREALVGVIIVTITVPVPTVSVVRATCSTLCDRLKHRGLTIDSNVRDIGSPLNPLNRGDR